MTRQAAKTALEIKICTFQRALNLFAERISSPTSERFPTVAIMPGRMVSIDSTTPASVKSSTAGTSALPMEMPSGPLVQRGRKPSRILYPPLVKKRWPQKKTDAAKRWLLALVGVMVLQILMEEPGQEGKTLSEDQMYDMSWARLNIRTLSNSSGGETVRLDKTSTILVMGLNSKATFEDVEATSQQTCQMFSTLQKGGKV